MRNTGHAFCAVRESFCERERLPSENSQNIYFQTFQPVFDVQRFIWTMSVSMAFWQKIRFVFFREVSFFFDN